MKQQIEETLFRHLEGQMYKHLLNASIMMENPIAIHDHTDLLSAIETELAHAAEYNDKLEMLQKIINSNKSYNELN
jgi:hypothetical protein